MDLGGSQHERLVSDVGEYLDASDGQALGVLPLRLPPGGARRAAIALVAEDAKRRGVVPVCPEDMPVTWQPPARARLVRQFRHRKVLVLPSARTNGGACDRAAMARLLCDLHVEARARVVVLEDASGGADIVAETAAPFGASDVGPAWFPFGTDAIGPVVARAETLGRCGRHAEALRALQRAAGERRRRGDVIAAAVLWLEFCRWCRVRGRHADGERAAAEARRHFGDAGHTRGVVASVLHLGWFALEDDRPRDAAGLFQVAEEAAGRVGDREASAAGSWASAWLACMNGRAEDAVARCERAVDRWPSAVVSAVADAEAVCDTGGEAFGQASRVLPSPRVEALAGLVRRRVAWELGRSVIERSGADAWEPQSVAVGTVERAAECEAEVIACASAGAWSAAGAALDRGLGELRRAHAPLPALALRLTFAECAARSGEGRLLDAQRTALTRWSRASLPGLFRRRLDAVLTRGGSDEYVTPEVLRVVAPPTASGGDDVLAVLGAFGEAGDEHTAIVRACEEARARLAAVALTVFVREGDRAKMTANVGGRPCDADETVLRLLVSAPDSVDDLTSALGRTDDHADAAPIAASGDVVGVVAARWLPGQRDRERGGRHLLRALALTIGPAVQALAAADVRAEVAGPLAAIVGGSPAVEALRAMVARAAAAAFPVLIQGESGTGKELAARAIHAGSPRAHKRFCAVNCAALTDDLVEAELFGHARGAFTGAVSDRAGLFEEADGGTLFLDEVGELSPRAQAKLLRAIQEREIRRVGENASRKVDVRLIAATNRPLADECVRGRFRSDLYYRLDVIRIAVPPLRDRPEDVRPLAERFWADAAAQVGSRAVLTADAIAALSARAWPGNVRELQNALASLAVRAPKRGRIGARDLEAAADGRNVRAGETTLDAARRRFELQFVREALARAGGHRGRAARELGVTRQGLAKLVTRLGLG